MKRSIFGFCLSAFLLGCGEENEATRSDSRGFRDTQTLQKEVGILAGTGVESPAFDDPSRDGWETEVWSREILTALRQVKDGLVSGDCRTAVAEIAVDGLAVPQLRPANLEVIDHRVSRLRSGTSLATSEDPAVALEGLSKPFERGRPRHAKAKIVRINKLDDRLADTLVLLQLDGPAVDQGLNLQINTRWNCRWAGFEKGWKLESIEVVSYEEVRTKAGHFVDVTGTVFENCEGLQDQFYRGQDHWMARVEMAHGIDVGGWQGISLADVDGDGLEDLYVAAPGGLPNRLLKHLPDGTVRDISHEAGVDWLEGTHGSLFADLDNDGDPDLIVGLGFGVVVMENNGAGRFEVKATKLMTDGLPYSIAAADVDHDGDLDFYVCGYNPRSGVSRHHVFAHPVPYHDANNGGRNALFRNDGGWRFVDVTKRTGMGGNNTRFSYAASWEDYDQDGDLDLYVANDFGRNNLYRNELVPTGRVRFIDVAGEAGVEDVAPGMSVSWGDFNNDGRSDLYVGNMYSSAGNRIAVQGRFQDKADEETRSQFLRHANGNSLFENQGGGRFSDRGVELGVNLGRWAWSSRFVDLDNDGWQDLVVTNGFVTQEDTGDL